MLGVLVVLSLALITIYFRESSSGGLHAAQSAGATVLRPFEVGAERVARPFRDVYGYFSGLVSAKSENKKLRREIDSLRQQVIQNQTAAAENEDLRRLLGFRDSPRFPAEYTAVNARVISRADSEFEQQVVIAAGSADGIPLHSPVVSADGDLAGEVSLIASHEAQVTLLTDPSSAVSALDLKTGAIGIVKHGQGAGSLILDRVTKDQNVREGDTIVTAGTVSGSLPSLYPRGIQIGRVTSVGQSDIALYKQIQVSPFVDFSGLDAVAVLVSRKPVPQLP